MLGEENILFMLVFVIGGIIFGALIMYLIMDARRHQQDAGEHRHTQPLTAATPPEDAQTVEIKPTMQQAVADVDRKKLLGFWRELKSDRLLVQMDDQWYENTKQMNDVLRVRYERTLREAAQWLDLALTRPDGEKRPDVPIAAAPATVSVGQVAGFVESPKRSMTIVEQVDEILQELLSESSLKGQNIRLSEMYNKGVVVWVGSHYFEGIEAVPDQEVKQIIKNAVKIWEVKNSSR